jgi:hypothetical protein
VLKPEFDPDRSIDLSFDDLLGQMKQEEEEGTSGD